jgi:cell division septation protein DedD
MRNNETGEFELTVGNRQLLSGFFIVVLLFAVAFAMGYVVGQNSPRSAKAMAEAATPPVSSADSGRPSASTAPPPQQPPAQIADTSAPPRTEAPPEPTTQPARESDAPGAASAELPPGSYWQVIAVAQQEAEVIYKTLKDRGFPTVMSPGPKNLVRVLVGPYNDTQSMGKAKTDLENAGFHPFRK